MRSILHVDMDAFYASVEVLQDPSLKGKPVIVGGSAERGVVASCSYEARAFGVRSAMSSSQANRLCPTAIWLAGNHGLYGEYSAQVHECFNAVTPLVEGIALDEAFLDVTGSVRLLGPPDDIAKSLRDMILERTGLQCSVGRASSKLLAKLASECAKPSVSGKPERNLPPGCRRASPGVVAVTPGEELAFLHAHPIGALWGVGPKTKERLARYGVATVADLAQLPVETVARALGSGNGRHLHALAHAIDERPVEADRGAKSIGHEETFESDLRSVDALSNEVVRMADAVSNRLRDANCFGRTITLKLKFTDFRLITRSKSLSTPTGSGVDIASIANALLREPETSEAVSREGVRLLGVSLSGLSERTLVAADQPKAAAPPADEQLDLFAAMATEVTSNDSRRDSPRNRQAERVATPDPRIDEAIAAVRAKFGDAALAPASLASSQGLRVKRRGDTQWGPSDKPAK
jgi:DNA polymerase IV